MFLDEEFTPYKQQNRFLLTNFVNPLWISRHQFSRELATNISSEQLAYTTLAIVFMKYISFYYDHVLSKRNESVVVSMLSCFVDTLYLP